LLEPVLNLVEAAHPLAEGGLGRVEHARLHDSHELELRAHLAATGDRGADVLESAGRLADLALDALHYAFPPFIRRYFLA
jgi:hypothetical protein